MFSQNDADKNLVTRSYFCYFLLIKFKSLSPFGSFIIEYYYYFFFLLFVFQNIAFMCQDNVSLDIYLFSSTAYDHK